MTTPTTIQELFELDFSGTKGDLTFCGISQKLNPTWIGWNEVMKTLEFKDNNYQEAKTLLFENGNVKEAILDFYKHS